MRVLNKQIWPFHCQIPVPDSHQDITDWLESSIGKCYRDWYNISLSTYYFKNEQDKILFLIRWA